MFRLLIVMVLYLTSVPVWAASSFLSTQDRAFVDGEGREVILHGMAVISKNRAQNYQPWQSGEDFGRMRQ